jgi:hypothetical protein
LAQGFDLSPRKSCLFSRTQQLTVPAFRFSGLVISTDFLTANSFQRVINVQDQQIGFG